MNVEHRRVTCDAEDLVLGFRGDRIHFTHRPYGERSAEARRDYDELRASLAAEGMRNPLITHRGHVLIGMRRLEIMRELGADELPCIEIMEDVSQWWRDDLPKLDVLKALYYR